MPHTSKIEILVFRHGQTDWNKERRLQGHKDIPLNLTGREQALSLVRKFERHQPELILTSDLSRAKETAAIANGHLALPMYETPHLRECHLGEVDGMLIEELTALFGEESWEQWLSIEPADHDFAFPGGETKTEHLTRMVTYIESYLKENRHLKKIAISTHGGSLRRLVHHCRSAPATPVPLGNCVMYQLSFDPTDSTWHFGKLIEDE